MRIYAYFIVAVFTVTTFAFPLQAQCRWEAEKVSAKVSAADETCLVTFKFKNVGTTPITFTKLIPSCGCTQVAMDKKTFMAGESGILKATVGLGDRVGRLSKFIGVAIVDGQTESTTKLEMSIDIASPLKISPEGVVWFSRQAITTQIVQVSTVGATAIHITSIESSHASMHSRILTLNDGQEYEIEITPTDVSTAIEATLIIHTDFKPSGHEKLRITCLDRVDVILTNEKLLANH